jgi:hypothetical protein
MVSDGGIEGVFQDNIRLGEAIFHVTFADFNMLEQVS